MSKTRELELEIEKLKLEIVKLKLEVGMLKLNKSIIYVYPEQPHDPYGDYFWYGTGDFPQYFQPIVTCLGE